MFASTWVLKWRRLSSSHGVNCSWAKRSIARSWSAVHAPIGDLDAPTLEPIVEVIPRTEAPARQRVALYILDGVLDFACGARPLGLADEAPSRINVGFIDHAALSCLAAFQAEQRRPFLEDSANLIREGREEHYRQYSRIHGRHPHGPHVRRHQSDNGVRPNAKRREPCRARRFALRHFFDHLLDQALGLHRGLHRVALEDTIEERVELRPAAESHADVLRPGKNHEQVAVGNRESLAEKILLTGEALVYVIEPRADHGLRGLLLVLGRCRVEQRHT